MYYGGLHARINHLYDCNCDDCKNNAGHIHLAAGDNPFKAVLTAAKNALKHLFSKGSYSPEDLDDKEYKKLIDETYNVFNRAIADNDIPDRMRQVLESDAFLFGGLKAHAQLSEAFSLIKDGKIKSWSEIEHEFDKLNDTYNRNWLQAEYNFAVNSAQQAANWANTDPDGRYNLQYRTALDEKVREEHAALEGITLPKEDNFWNHYYPPNGWNCRCTAVEVRKSKYEESDSEKAIEKGEAATSKIGKDGKNRLEIFRFNPGKEEKLFPPKHPYGKVKGAKIAQKSIEEIEQKKGFIPEKIKDYEKELNIKADPKIFEYLQKETPLYTEHPGGIKGTGAFYEPNKNYVHIPIDQRRKNSPWYAKAVVHHEYGHAIDWQLGIKESKEVKDLMDKYRKGLDFKKVDERLINFHKWGLKRMNYDLLEQVGACRDALMSLNTNYGRGHELSYWEIKGNKEAEFIAHAFENTFSGNKVFKKVMPELYKESAKLIKSFKPK